MILYINGAFWRGEVTEKNVTQINLNEDVIINSSTPANSGTYSLTITENGCVSLPQTVDVVVYPTPVASPTTSTFLELKPVNKA